MTMNSKEVKLKHAFIYGIYKRYGNIDIIKMTNSKASRELGDESTGKNI